MTQSWCEYTSLHTSSLCRKRQYPRSIATQPRYEHASPRDVVSINMADGNNSAQPGRSQYVPNTNRLGDG